MKKGFLALGIIFLISLAACNNNDSQTGDSNNSEPAPAIINYSVVTTYPHDTSFFTEGLEFHEGKLMESSGGSVEEELVHPSAFGIADLKTGKVDRKVQLNNAIFFGEGITVFNGKIYQLTWKNNKGFVYDAKTFRKLSEFPYQGDGWALTHDSTRLIMSDGTSNLRFLDPQSLQVLSILGVHDNNGPVGNINELEYIDGYLYANAWQTNHILKIDLSSGKVVGKLDLSTLVHEIRSKSATADVLNGIAYRSDTKTMYVTGKLWPLIYEIKLN